VGVSKAVTCSRGKLTLFLNEKGKRKQKRIGTSKDTIQKRGEGIAGPDRTITRLRYAKQGAKKVKEFGKDFRKLLPFNSARFGRKRI